jgi:hypothetical protein
MPATISLPQQSPLTPHRNRPLVDCPLNRQNPIQMVDLVLDQLRQIILEIQNLFVPVQVPEP